MNRASAVGIAAAALALARHFSRRLASELAIGAAALLLVLAVFPIGAYVDRFSVLWNPAARHATASLDRATILERLELWSGSLAMAAEHPWVGVGPGNSGHMIGRYASVGDNLVGHNSLLSVAAETGFPGLLLYAAVFVLALASLERAARRRHLPDFSDAARAMQAAIVAYLAAGLFVSRHDMALAYLIAGSAVALCAARDSISPHGADPGEPPGARVPGNAP
jgi:O-antigen ligase